MSLGSRRAWVCCFPSAPLLFLLPTPFTELVPSTATHRPLGVWAVRTSETDVWRGRAGSWGPAGSGVKGTVVHLLLLCPLTQGAHSLCVLGDASFRETGSHHPLWPCLSISRPFPATHRAEGGCTHPATRNAQVHLLTWACASACPLAHAGEPRVYSCVCVCKSVSRRRALCCTKAPLPRGEQLGKE